MPAPSEPSLSEFLVGLRPLAYAVAERRLQAFLRAVRPWNETCETLEPALSDFVTALVRAVGRAFSGGKLKLGRATFTPSTTLSRKSSCSLREPRTPCETPNKRTVRSTR